MRSMARQFCFTFQKFETFLLTANLKSHQASVSNRIHMMYASHLYGAQDNLMYLRSTKCSTQKSQWVEIHSIAVAVNFFYNCFSPNTLHLEIFIDLAGRKGGKTNEKTCIDKLPQNSGYIFLTTLLYPWHRGY